MWESVYVGGGRGEGGMLVEMHTYTHDDYKWTQGTYGFPRLKLCESSG